ncbi:MULTISPECIES: phosphatase PAP2 family protein [Bordetella]|uniref:Acid phosphatase n=1 Tax=Bordetella genomosp. 6 TaxID=463024 RepID=A0ABX4F8R8_9BORD|nr:MULTISPECIES: phosphatase PAP2 family protein [Bordetella]AZW43197.1 phosphatase PAP2 family protein [Bordetella bronchiseptica]OZI72938.1 acid phosphatase [Bordetella genomosp. 6]
MTAEPIAAFPPPQSGSPGQGGLASLLRRCLVPVLLLLGCAAWIDRPLTLWINRSVSPQLNTVFDYIGNLGDSGTYVTLGLAAYILGLQGMLRGWAAPWGWTCETIARAGMLLLATLTAGGLVTWVLKNIVARARPEVLLDDGIYGMGRMFAGSPFNSFPSSHTQTAFAVAAVLGILAPRWRWPALALAALVAISRVINRDHYLSDVCAAALIAVVAAYAIKPYVLSPSHTWPLRAPWRWRKRG